MDHSNAHLYLPAVEALRDKELQWLNPSTGKWQDTDCAGFEYTPDCYRRRPKPREFWVVVEKDGSGVAYPKRAEADLRTFLCKKPTIRVREVIE